MMPFALGDAMPGLDDRRDGCDCPPYVQRCAHFDDRRLWLVSGTLGSEELERRGRPLGSVCSECGRTRTSFSDKWIVIGPGVYEPARCSCSIELTCQSTHIDVRWTSNGPVAGWQPGSFFKNEADATAAFEAEEARLLGREVRS